MRQNLGPALLHGGTPEARLRYVSPSAIERADASGSYGGCLRRWYYRYVERREEPSTPGQEAGTRLHLEIERYLRTGERALSSLALAGARFLPEPSRELRLEEPLVRIATGEIVGPLSVDDIPVVGYMDVVNLSGKSIDDRGEVIYDPTGTVEVIDWKRTGSAKRYQAATTKSVADSVQMTTYGAYILRNHGSVSWVRMSHGYFLDAGKPQARKVTLRVLPQDIDKRWSRVSGVVREMAQVAKCASAAEVDPNLRACDAYGGCAYRSVCPGGQAKTLEDMFGPRARDALLGRGGDEMTSALDGLDFDEKPDLSAFFEPESVGVTSSPYPAEFPEWVRGIESAKVKGQPAGFPATTGAAARALAALRGVEIKQDALAGTGVLGAKRTCATPEEVGAIYEGLVKMGAIAMEEAPVAEPPPPAILPPDAPESNPLAAVAAQAEKKGRGRPKKTNPPAVAAGPAPQTPPASSGTEAVAGGATQAIEIFVDCYPTSGAWSLLDPYVREQCAAVAEFYGAIDARFPPDEKSPIAFSKGKVAVGARCREKLPAPGRYVLRRDTEIEVEVAEALGEYVVARGFTR